jgi:hypothetical protein
VKNVSFRTKLIVLLVAAAAACVVVIAFGISIICASGVGCL